MFKNTSEVLRYAPDTGGNSPLNLSFSQLEFCAAGLEKIALETQAKANWKIDGTQHSTTLTAYEKMMGFDILNAANVIRERVPRQHYLFADIGGAAGTAAKEFEMSNPDFSAFCIDPQHDQTFGAELPQNRYIIAGVEKMEMIPDQSLHFITCFNTLTSQDISVAFTEISRVLAPGAWAIVDVEHWPKEGIEALKTYNFPKGTAGYYSGSIYGVHPLKKVVEIAEKADAEVKMRIGFQSCIIIERRVPK